MSRATLRNERRREGPHEAADHGGLNLSRFTSSYAIAAFMIVCIWFTSRKSKDDAGLPPPTGARAAPRSKPCTPKNRSARVTGLGREPRGLLM